MSEAMKKLLGSPEVITLEGVEIKIYPLGVDELETVAPMGSIKEGEEMTVEQARALTGVIKSTLRKSGVFEEAELGSFPISKHMQVLMTAINKVNDFEKTPVQKGIVKGRGKEAMLARVRAAQQSNVESK